MFVSRKKHKQEIQALEDLVQHWADEAGRQCDLRVAAEAKLAEYGPMTQRSFRNDYTVHQGFEIAIDHEIITTRWESEPVEVHRQRVRKPGAEWEVVP